MTKGKGKLPPPATSRFVVKDEGNASPHYLRSTSYSVPHSVEMIKETDLPIGLVITPLAVGGPRDTPLSLGTSLEAGPVRCSHCNGYVSPSAQFSSGGRT